MVRTSRWIATAALLAVGACGTSDPAPNDPAGPFRSEVNLAALLPATADLIGLASTPEGRLYVLDRHSGLYKIDGSGATLVFSTVDLATRFGVPADLELTDIVALGNDRFAVTAENDGYMLDLHNQAFASYFCYLPAVPGDPGGGPIVVPPSVSQTLRSQGIAVKERTESVAFSFDSFQLFAQPQTIRIDTGEIMGSELFVFSDSGGQPIQVRAMPSTGFVAGGMLAVAGQRLLLASHNQIFTMDESTGPVLTREFDPSIEISGLARDLDGTLLLLDRAGRRLLETTLY